MDKNDLKGFANTIKPAWQAAMAETGHFSVAVKRTLAKVEGPAWHFTEGATSYPTNLFAALVQLAALSGNLGEQMRYAAHFRQAMIDRVMCEAYAHPILATQLFWYYAKHHLVSIAGSVSGAFLCNSLVFRRFPTIARLSFFKKLPITVPLAILAKYGAANLAISYGIQDYQRLIGVLATNNPMALLSHAVTIEVDRLSVTPSQIQAMQQLCKALQEINHVHVG